jgi:hypothetical protein
MRWLRDNSLSIFFGVLLLAALVGQSIAGHLDYNEEQRQHDSETISYGRYVFSSSFGRAMLENWQSEWLQFVLFTLATIWLIQKGSNESKQPQAAGTESDEQQRVGEHAQRNSPPWAKLGPGLRRWLYSYSLVLVMALLFVGSWIGQSVTGWTEFNDDQRDHDSPTVSYLGYLGNPRFWEETLQNWQSEFLAVGAMAVFTIYFRARGSPESKPVGAPHCETE